MLAFILLLAMSKPVLYTFDPTAIHTYSCSLKNTEYMGSYVLCHKGELTFSKVRIGAPLPESIRIKYIDGSIFQYYPKKCKLKNQRKGIYQCPEVITGPQPKQDE